MSMCPLFAYHHAHRHPHSFPTRRSSDLAAVPASTVPSSAPAAAPAGVNRNRARRGDALTPAVVAHAQRDRVIPGGVERMGRSEEHTSELQSRRDLVCRLLLEKKKSQAKA